MPQASASTAGAAALESQHGSRRVAAVFASRGALHGAAGRRACHHASAAGGQGVNSSAGRDLAGFLQEGLYTVESFSAAVGGVE